MSHGGARSGAGRPAADPKLKKVQNAVKLPRWMTDWLNDNEEPKAQLIEKAILKAYKLKPPKT